MTEKELQDLVVSTDKRAATLTSGVRLVRTAPYKDPREDPRVVEIFFCVVWRPDGKGNVTYGAMYTIWTREDGGSNGIPERLRAQDGEIILSPGTMYGSLSKMEKDGLICFVREEEKRKIYHITGLGQEVLDLETKRIERLYRNVKEVLG